MPWRLVQEMLVTNLVLIRLVETYIPNEERKDKSGFLNVKSVFTSGYGNEPAQSPNLTVWCMALIPVPGNQVGNVSSEKITLSLGELSNS